MKLLNIEEYFEQGELITIYTVLWKSHTKYIKLSKHEAKNINNENELIKYIDETSRQVLN
jgi:hypothetical protein